MARWQVVARGPKDQMKDEARVYIRNGETVRIVKSWSTGNIYHLEVDKDAPLK